MLKYNNSKSSVTGGLGTMGFGLPAAIGAWYGAPEKTVVILLVTAVSNDFTKLGTIMQFGAKVKILILTMNFLR